MSDEFSDNQNEKVTDEENDTEKQLENNGGSAAEGADDTTGLQKMIKTSSSLGHEHPWARWVRPNHIKSMKNSSTS